jgi:hypothetical protein
VAIRDSAGIQIVENRLKTDGDSGIVRVAGRPPDLSIGAVEGDSAYLFSTVWGTRRLSSGAIAVLNQDSYQVRYFDSAGKFVRAIGRKGDGPGEFPGRFGPRTICPLSVDSLAVVDGQGVTVSTFDPDGKYVRRITMPPAPSGRRLMAYGCTPHGNILATSAIIRVEPRPGVWSDSIELHWVNADGTPGSSIGQFRHHDRYQVMRPSGPGAADVIFGGYLVYAVGDEEVFVGTHDTYQISVYGRDGKLKRVVRYGIGVRTVTDSMQRAHEAAGAKAAAARAAERGVPATPPDEARYAKTIPPYRRFWSGRDGSLWVLRNEPLLLTDSTRVNRWDVFDSNGRWRAAIDLPAELDLLDAGSSYALGTWRNSDGVEFVHLYRFSMPEVN